MQQTDLDIGRSFDRLNRSEEYKARTLGRGLNKQGQALTRKYLRQLSDVIAADRAASRRDRSLWLVLKDIDHEELALRLLIAGISATDARVGVDDNGDKDFLHQCLWIGCNLLDGRRHKRELQFKLGAWGAEMLLTLPAFAPVGDILTLAADLNDFMDDVFVRAIRNNPLLSPLTTPPESWTDIRKGGLPPDRWAHVPLIRPHHPSIEAAAREAIRTGQMQKVAYRRETRIALGSSSARSTCHISVPFHISRHQKF